MKKQKNEELEITTMCAIVHNGKVLMLDRIKSWKGWAFPGGHLEEGESLTVCIKREIEEETGLVLENLSFKGITHFLNTKSGVRHMIFDYYSDRFGGELLKEGPEGRLQWIPINELDAMDMAEGMQYRLPIFFSNSRTELYVEWDEDSGYTKIEYYEE